MKRIYLILSTLIITSVIAYAGWETFTQLTSIADDDLIVVQDVSDTSASANGTTKHSRMDTVASWIKDKIGSFSGAGTTALVPDPTTDDGRLLDTSGWTNTVSADFGGFPAGCILYADAEGNLQPHPTVDMNELSSLDGAEGNLDDRITALETAGGLDGLSVSVGGESDNTIVATIAGPAHNSLMEVWLSATDGGTYTTAFDGDSAAPWTLSDATAHITRTADVAYQILTGADGDAVVTFKHSNAASPTTKYLCAECAGWVQCGEITFSAESNPCVMNDEYSITTDDGYSSGGYNAGIGLTANANQRFEGGDPITICAVIVSVQKDAGDDATIIAEILSDAGSVLATSESVEATADGIGADLEFVFTSPYTTDGNPFRIRITNQDSASVYAAAFIFSNNLMYSTTEYDFSRNGTDVNDDLRITVKTQ